METKKDYTIEIQIYTEVLNILGKNLVDCNYSITICNILKLTYYIKSYSTDIQDKLNINEIMDNFIKYKPVNAYLYWFWFPSNKQGLRSRIELVRKVIKDLNKLQR